MRIFPYASRRTLLGRASCAIVLSALLIVLATLPQGAVANGANPPLIVGNDRGGMVLDRLRQLRELRSSGRPVEIRGRVCFSTCTMLLGLPQVCISPKTTFGFHGPTRAGKRMPPEDFDYVSRVIAHYYPAELKSWYIAEGRHRLMPLHRIKGAEIIRMGIRAC